MSDFMAKLVDRHLDRLPKNFKWYLLIIIVIVAFLFSNRMTKTPLPNAQTNVGTGSSGSALSGYALQSK